MSDTETKVLISGDASGAVDAMNQAATAVKESIAEMKESLSSISESFEGVQSFITGIGALFAGGIFKEIVASTQEWTEHAIDLGLQLGISTEQASVYAVAIKEVGGTTDDFAAASSGLTRQLRTHEKALNAMGIATRDSNGALLDGNTILFNAIDAVNSYAAGTDRNLAAQTAFGRGVTASSAILRLHREDLDAAAATAEKLGLVVGGPAAEAFEHNRRAMADVNLMGQSMSIQIGQALIPILQSLATAFSSEASPMANMFGQIIVWVGQGVLTLWYGLKELGTMLGGLGAAVARLSHGDMAGFHGVMGQLRMDLKQMSDDGDAAIKKLGELSSAVKAASAGDGAPAGGDKKFTLVPKEDKAAIDSRLADWKNALAEAAQAEGDFDNKDIAMQLAYWQQKAAITNTGAKEDAKIHAEIEKEILTLTKKAHDEGIKEQEEYLKTVETLELGEVAAKQAALQQEFAMGKITQAQEIAGEVELANEKYAIEKKALDDKLALANFDALAQQKIRDQELVLEQKHAAEVQKIVNKSELDQKKTWDQLFSSMQSGFASTIEGFLKGTTTIGGAIKGLFQDIGNSIISMIANLAAKYLETSLMQIVSSKTSGVAIIGTLAAQAAAGAFASTAAIPYVGPELAPAAAALAYSDTMAFQAAASAAGGYDIPAGINPMTQLHAQEMVLPRDLANVVRKGVGQSAGRMVNLTVNAIDAASFAKAINNNGSAVSMALKRLNGRFMA